MTARALPSWFALCHTTTKLPAASDEMRGAACSPGVKALTRNSPPCGFPRLSKRRPTTASPLPSWLLSQTITKLPPGRGAILGLICGPVNHVFTRNSPVRGFPEASKTRAKMSRLGSGFAKSLVQAMM
jgi:hypothetical protein